MAEYRVDVDPRAGTVEAITGGGTKLSLSRGGEPAAPRATTISNKPELTLSESKPLTQEQMRKEFREGQKKALEMASKTYVHPKIRKPKA